MGNEISWQVDLAVKPGELDNYRALTGEMVEFTKAEPGTLIYEYFISKDGQFIYVHEHRGITAGLLGDSILVNGTYAPYIEVPAKLIRLRLLNGSAARRYNFGFSDNCTFHLIATDGGLLEAPVEQTRLLLSPGERAEILVDLSNLKEPIRLMSSVFTEGENAVQNAIQEQLAGGTDEGQQYCGQQ